ncbi:hypothetical protein Golax_022435 [Gossypium laxum]|uniref:Rab3 GTPase-activating protein catalytic subunit n=1 Tax=Gossypium laxum TaxID=34288 RepID=A0A7J9B277_9ROSI|nr:hypothetical protein [Gossypium laxum]
MSAFKAANPDAVFEDFIRWHSPGDWENDGSEANDEWPPRGKLSQRMSGPGNSWRKIWNDAPSLPAYEQKPLLDPNREGEKFHYPDSDNGKLLTHSQVCDDDVSRGKPFSNLLSGNSEKIEDLKRLCVALEHVEKLLTLAASLRHKFIQAPRVYEAIFSDYYDFYLSNMGKGSADVDIKKEFDLKLQLRMSERQVVSNMFTPPTANQSWRKVLSMGNLLNGHEPILRQIVFSKRDSGGDCHYAVSTRGGPHMDDQQEIETYRMYVCGTSNDLRVALCVTSYD